MNIKKMLAASLFSVALIMPFIGEAATQALKISSVRSVMTEMLEQHIGNQGLSTQTFQQSVDHFIELADPWHVYFTEQEIAPFLQTDDKTLVTAVSEYQKDQYPLFAQLNEAVQKGIQRARQMRQFDASERNALFERAKALWNQGQQIVPDEAFVGFAANQADLKRRLGDHFVDYVLGQISRFGVDDVMSHQDLITKKYEGHFHHAEGEYLYLTLQDKPLSAEDQENLFATHILKALAKSLDAHSSFFDEGEAMDMKMRLEKGFVGIGVVISEVIDGFKITELLPDSPAKANGQILVNDRLLEINGKPLFGLELEDTLHLIRGGVAGDPVKLVVASASDGKNRREINLKQQMIIVQTGRVDSSFEKYKNGIIGRLTLHSFYEGPNDISSANDLKAAIANLQKQGKLIGLVLDLRDNSGGYLTQAVKVAGLFITSGVVVMSKYTNGDEQIYRDVDGEAAYTGPLVILTSKLTASAAEIVSQTLQDYGIAVVVGDDHTYGKGTIQAQNVTEGGTSPHFKVTVGKYYTVSGKTTQIRGVEANVVLPGEYSAMRIGESYLNTSIGNDSIEPEFRDTLKDIEPSVRDWYANHYLSTLQPREDIWQRLMPQIQKRSTERVSRDAHYQAFLRGLSGKSGGSNERFDIGAYQLGESTLIVRDMIDMSADLQMAGVPAQNSAGIPFQIGARLTPEKNY